MEGSYIRDGKIPKIRAHFVSLSHNKIQMSVPRSLMEYAKMEVGEVRCVFQKN